MALIVTRPSGHLRIWSGRYPIRHQAGLGRTHERIAEAYAEAFEDWCDDQDEAELMREIDDILLLMAPTVGSH